MIYVLGVMTYLLGVYLAAAATRLLPPQWELLEGERTYWAMLWPLGLVFAVFILCISGLGLLGSWLVRLSVPRKPRVPPVDRINNRKYVLRETGERRCDRP